MRRPAILAATLALTLALCRAATAGLLFDLSGGATGYSVGADSTAGFSFSVDAPITVGALAFWDEGADGLGCSHDVGLWTAAGTLLRTVTVTTLSPAAGSGSLDGRWLYEAVAPLPLGPGSYVIGAFFRADDASDPARLGTTVASDAGAVFGEVRWLLQGAGAAFPADAVAGIDAGFFGPNLLLLPAPAPAGAMAAALALLLLARRRG